MPINPSNLSSLDELIGKTKLIKKTVTYPCPSYPECTSTIYSVTALGFSWCVLNVRIHQEEGSLWQDVRETRSDITKKEHNGVKAQLPTRALLPAPDALLSTSQAPAEAERGTRMPRKAPLPGPPSLTGHFCHGSSDPGAEVSICQRNSSPERT